AKGRLVSETDANGQTRRYAYDELDRLISHTDSLGGRTTLTYDARGNVIEVKDAKRQAHTFAYDRNNRLTARTLPMGQRTTYQYDAAGNLARQVGPQGAAVPPSAAVVTEYSHDALHRLIEVRQLRSGDVLA